MRLKFERRKMLLVSKFVPPPGRKRTGWQNAGAAVAEERMHEVHIRERLGGATTLGEGIVLHLPPGGRGAGLAAHATAARAML